MINFITIFIIYVIAIIVNIININIITIVLNYDTIPNNIIFSVTDVGSWALNL